MFTSVESDPGSAEDCKQTRKPLRHKQEAAFCCYGNRRNLRWAITLLTFKCRPTQTLTNVYYLIWMAVLLSEITDLSFSALYLNLMSSFAPKCPDLILPSRSVKQTHSTDAPVQICEDRQNNLPAKLFMNNL